MAKKRKNRIGSIAKGGKFVTPVGGGLGHYMKYGDFNPHEVAPRKLVHRGRDYSEEGGDSITAYGGIARGQGFKAFRYGGKLYKPNPSGGPALKQNV